MSELNGKTKKRTMREMVEYWESLNESADNEVVVELKKLKGKIGGIVSKMDGGGAKWSMDNQYRFNPVVRRDGGIEVSMRIEGDYGYPIGENDGDLVDAMGYDVDLVIYMDKGVSIELHAESDMDDVRDVDVIYEHKGKLFDAKKDLVGLISKVFDLFDVKVPEMDEYDTDDEEGRVMGRGGFGKWSNPSLFKK